MTYERSYNPPGLCGVLGMAFVVLAAFGEGRLRDQQKHRGTDVAPVSSRR